VPAVHVPPVSGRFCVALADGEVAALGVADDGIPDGEPEPTAVVDGDAPGLIVAGPQAATAAVATARRATAAERPITPWCT
jgi:hypothetical protein